MTLAFDSAGASLPTGRERRIHDGARARKSGAIINIALVNNMPDKALKATEQQYRRLFRAVSGTSIVRLHCFSLPSVARSPEALAAMDGSYVPIEALGSMTIDGLIATGAEPVAPALSDEPFWPALTELVDWAEANTVSAIWSCLAAHAAVLHLDGIERRRLPAKCSGIYRCEPVVRHWLLRDLDGPLAVAHSRLNAIDSSDLTQHGYDVLTRSREAGVDAFARPGPSEFVFFQGHPEYDALTLKREFTRDVGRFLRGEQPTFPDPPANYFDGATEAALAAFRTRVAAERNPRLATRLPALTLRPEAETAPRESAERLFGNWLAHLVARRRG